MARARHRLFAALIPTAVCMTQWAVSRHLRRRSEREQRFLADVGLVLGSSLELADTLSQVAELAVRDFAECCIIDLRDETGRIHREAVVFRDPSRAWVAELLRQVTLDEIRPSLTSEAIRTGRAVLRRHVSDEMIRSFSHSERHHEILRALAPSSLIAAPLIAHGTRLGAIAFVLSTPGCAFGLDDLRVAEELARRAALAIENAQLYGVAKRAAHARDEVLGIVAHDLRSPLSSIGLQAELLTEQSGDDNRRAAALIQRSARRMDRLIQDLLDVTRMEANRLTVDAAVLPANETLASVIEAQQLLTRKAGLYLDSEADDHLPALWADRDRLHQIFENLIGNALKFTKRGGITVGAAARDGEVLFWVRDTGAGIPADALPLLFDRFWQGHRERRAGAGLGLAIVKGLVEAHGGRIWVDSTPEKGSCFFFTIPMAPRSSESVHPGI